MKVIFLDVDGVLNNHSLFKKTKDERSAYANSLPEFDDITQEQWTMFYGYMIDPYAISLLKDILQATDAKIVVSSTWRNNDKTYNALKENLKNHGIDCIVGKTPRFPGELRGTEIQQYLNENQGIENYVIIDDDSDMLDEQKSNFVQTNTQIGLTADDAKKVIEIL